MLLNLFADENNESDSILNYISSRISPDDDLKLTSPFTIDEFKDALFQMDSNKSLGPDGHKPTFYKKFWNLLGPEIFSTTTFQLENNTFPSQINSFTIALISKSNNPKTMKDFIPISFRNILYKIISKTLANRLKPFLEKCISKEQSNFVEGHSILDNALIASEIIHHEIQD